MLCRIPQPSFSPCILAALLAVALAGCGPGRDAGQAAPAAPPPEVGVITVALGDVEMFEELPGRLEASRTAQVRARAAGIVQERLFKEGADVRAGQPLFRIDAAPYQAAVASAQAALSRAQASLTQSSALVERYRPLVEANAISKQEYANAVAAQKQAEAEVAAGRAAMQTAQINLNQAQVVAPISGRIGRALVTEGALVGQGEATPLALIQQIHPIMVNFTQPAGEVLKLQRALAQGKLKRVGPDAAAVRVLLEDGSEYPQAGRLLFTDLSVDPASGQVMLRAEVPNPSGALLPGLYVRVRLEQAKAGNAVLLPQQAVTRSGEGDTVMVVAPDGQVTPRPVKVGNAQAGQWLILEGLKAGEQVVVDGFQKLRPNAPVKPVPWKPASAPAAASTASAPKS